MKLALVLFNYYRVYYTHQTTPLLQDTVTPSPQEETIYTPKPGDDA